MDENNLSSNNKLLSQKELASWTTALGSIPFILGAVLLWIDFQPLFLPAGLKMIVHAYAVVIGSFICGLHWGIHLNPQTSLNLNLYLFNAIIALVLWVSLAGPGSTAALIIAMLCFIALWVLDFRLYHQKATPPWFFGLRTLGTLIVLGCLLALVLF